MIAFVVLMSWSYSPTDFMHRYAGGEGEVLARRYPCFCDGCMNEDYASCTHAGKAGFDFKSYIMRKKGTRVPKSRIGGGVARAVEVEEDNVEEVIGSREYKGVYQYEVVMKGQEQAVWMDADKLLCTDLIEEFEINK